MDMVSTKLLIPSHIYPSQPVPSDRQSSTLQYSTLSAQLDKSYRKSPAKSTFMFHARTAAMRKTIETDRFAIQKARSPNGHSSPKPGDSLKGAVQSSMRKGWGYAIGTAYRYGGVESVRALFDIKEKPCGILSFDEEDLCDEVLRDFVSNKAPRCIQMDPRDLGAA
ncbi:hypothetical protein BS50DRAFT_626816 [Corynespora cassiicola Philippines]|uniref:Uncharacterized protein n=1 Tax=Corynespora cassiicola Philippines TaxID=1448308 RepID=A0A2T2N1D0_CORCC|nr:hypothetical protein BS50DRAFT_626816 [Corynespora cassiicola Philippines]